MKPGWKTTEFWMSLLGSVAAILAAVSGILPAEYAGIVVAVSGGLYTVSRGLAKSRPAVMVEPGKPMPDGGPATVMGGPK